MIGWTSPEESRAGNAEQSGVWIEYRSNLITAIMRFQYGSEAEAQRTLRYQGIAEYRVMQREGPLLP